MLIAEKSKHILAELKGHAPFTLFGAVLGMIFMLLFTGASTTGRYRLFTVFHPAHVIFSAMVTASIFKLHSEKRQFIIILIIGYFGSIGVATLSDIVIPHIGTHLLGLDVPTHAESAHNHQQHDNTGNNNEHRKEGIHLGFIEEWYIVNPAAILGVLIAYFLPRTKLPHAGHVLISTWASSSYLLMNTASEMTITAISGIFATLFVAVWLPCCISDIIFPLLFVKSDIELAEPCPVHDIHSHPHIHKQGQ